MKWKEVDFIKWVPLLQVGVNSYLLNQALTMSNTLFAPQEAINNYENSRKGKKPAPAKTKAEIIAEAERITRLPGSGSYQAPPKPN